MAAHSELKVMKMISEGLSALDKPARERVLRWANAKFLGKGDKAALAAAAPVLTAAPANKKRSAPAKTAVKRVTAPPLPKKPRSATKKRSSTPKKSKLMIRQIRDLDLHPEGEPVRVKKKRVLLL